MVYGTKLCGQRASTLLVTVMVLMGGGWAGGMEIPRYFNGVEGLKCGSAPPPGFYLRSYNCLYHSTDMKDDKGKSLDIDFELNVAATAERFIWMSDWTKKAIGADFGVYAIVPFEYSSVKMGAMGVDDERFRVGDIEVCPAMLAWHFPRVDLTLAYEFIAPVGDYHQGEAATMCIGYDYWTHQPTFGVTGYLDAAKTWTISLLPRYEFHTERRNRHYTAGDQFHFEWGVGKSFSKIGLEVGVTGYCSWQTTDDKGRGVMWDAKVHDRVYAVGPEVNYNIKPIGLNMAVRYQREFGARDRMEGHRATLMFTKRF